MTTFDISSNSKFKKLKKIQIKNFKNYFVYKNVLKLKFKNSLLIGPLSSNARLFCEPKNERNAMEFFPLFILESKIARSLDTWG